MSEFWPVQPEPGSVADQLIKKGISQGVTQGISQGISQGEAREKRNTIRTLQSILALPMSSEEELSGKQVDDRQSIIETLQHQIAARLKQ